MSNGLVQAGHQLDADDGGQVLLAPVLFDGSKYVGAGHGAQQGGGAFVTAHLHPFGGEHRADLGQEVGGLIHMHEQRLSGVARADFLRLGVVGDLDGQGHIDLAVDINMAVAIQVFDDRHCGLGTDALDEAFATTGDDDVDKLRQGDELAHGGAVGGLHQLHGVLGQPCIKQRLLNQSPQCQVRCDGL